MPKNYLSRKYKYLSQKTTWVESKFTKFSEWFDEFIYLISLYKWTEPTHSKIVYTIV